ncbi:Theileria-specific sub-telomeric protein, SVSP family, putative [Theileria annulata]|uniref:Theileria-specific sub-telomeric protein, SVSP family, putative n=1 Tax=Theileria annulata TaxID=5874 RepID=Q4UD75_THEAN|nr:Theileria-specific sub-telomeric protein, SVSP family, putative [Theileria annulata]CAI74964.1 Theileria-specific sub-telomeric protein, SVSP family, putative [Theileria annulata]|eukprot:XP_952696.1 Theileria-specific sub-telomeric protein, SVSP family, putative [Theileria annulata]
MNILLTNNIMDRCLNYKCVIILILIKCVYSSDKPINTHITTGDGSDNEEDNFEVTETTEITEGVTGTQTEPVKDVETQTDPQQTPHPIVYYLVGPHPEQQPIGPQAYYQPVYQQPYHPIPPQYYTGYGPPQPYYPGPYEQYQPYQQAYQPHQQPQPQPQYYPHPGYQVPYQPYPPYLPQQPTYQPYPGYQVPYQPYGRPPPIQGPTPPKEQSEQITRRRPKFRPKDQQGQFGLGGDEITQVVSKEPKFCKAITLMKKNEDGNLVQMTEKDYKILFEDNNITKYEPTCDVEQVLCDDDSVYEHRPGDPYSTLINYNISENKFILKLVDGFLFFKHRHGKWLPSKHRIPNYVKYFSKDSEGNDVEINSENYELELSSTGAIRCEFKVGVQCYKILYKDTKVWEKSSIEKFPSLISYTIKEDFMIYYDNTVKIYKRYGRKFVLFSTRPNKKYYKSP